MARTATREATPSLASLPERVSVLEERVRNIDEKVDEIKDGIKDIHNNMTKSNDTLVQTLKDMREASTSQHAEMATKIKDLEGFKDKWVYLVLGGIAVVGWLSGHFDTILKFVGK